MNEVQMPVSQPSPFNLVQLFICNNLYDKIPFKELQMQEGDMGYELGISGVSPLMPRLQRFG